MEAENHLYVIIDSEAEPEDPNLEKTIETLDEKEEGLVFG